MVGEVEKAPELKRAPTRSEKAKEAVEGRRVTRSMKSERKGIDDVLSGCLGLFYFVIPRKRRYYCFGSICCPPLFILMKMALLTAMAAAAAAAGSLAAARGIGDVAVGRAPGPRHPQTAAAYTPLYCAGGLGGSADDDDSVGESGHQGLYVNLTYAECTSITLPLLASFLGGTITAGDLRCYVCGSARSLLPFTQLPSARSITRRPVIPPFFRASYLRVSWQPSSNVPHDTSKPPFVITVSIARLLVIGSRAGARAGCEHVHFVPVPRSAVRYPTEPPTTALSDFPTFLVRFFFQQDGYPVPAWVASTDCYTVTAALNARLGGKAFSCDSVGGTGAPQPCRAVPFIAHQSRFLAIPPLFTAVKQLGRCRSDTPLPLHTVASSFPHVRRRLFLTRDPAAHGRP